MTHTVSREIRLNNRPEGMPQQNDFELAEDQMEGNSCQRNRKCPQSIHRSF